MSLHFIMSREYELGIEKLDHDHELILKTAYSIYNDVKNIGDLSKVEDTYNDLLSYINMHFSFEEMVMRTYTYPHIEEHVTAHKGFRNKIIEMIRLRDDGESICSLEIVEFIRIWFMNHLHTIDRKLCSFLIMNKIKI